MAEEIQKTPREELSEAVEEEWSRAVDDDVRGLSVSKCRANGKSVWDVFIEAAEFIREEPLESTFRQQMVAALKSVPGVEKVQEGDREVWLVTGATSGQDLAIAAARVVDGLAGQIARVLESAVVPPERKPTQGFFQRLRTRFF